MRVVSNMRNASPQTFISGRGQSRVDQVYTDEYKSYTRMARMLRRMTGKRPGTRNQ